MNIEKMEKDIECHFVDACGAHYTFREIIDNLEDKDIYDIMIEWAEKHGANFDCTVDDFNKT